MKKLIAALKESANSGRFNSRVSTFLPASKAVFKLENQGFQAKILRQAKNKSQSSFLFVSWEEPKEETLAMELHLLAKKKALCP